MTTYSVLNPPLSHPSGDVQYWGQLQGASLGLAINQLASKSDNFFVLITPDPLTAIQLEQALSFFSADKNLPILHFPDWETLPYDVFSPHQDIISERLKTLFKLPTIHRGILITPVTTLMHKVAPRDYLERFSFVLNKGDRFDVDDMRLRLEKRGYRCVNKVYEHGEFAVRGSLFDIFPMGNHTPFRIDLFGNEVDSIRTFHPEDQRTVDIVNAIELLPAKEFPLDPQSISLFRQNWRENFHGNPTQCPIYENISQGICSGGIEYYLPLFYPQLDSLLDYLPHDATIMHIGNTHQSAVEFTQETQQRYQQYHVDISRPLLAPEKLFLTTETLFQNCKSFAQIHLSTEKIKPQKSHRINFATQLAPNIIADNKLKNPLDKLLSYIEKIDHQILFCAESPGRREVLLSLLGKQKIHPHYCDNWQAFIDSKEKFNITVAPLYSGVEINEPEKLCIIAESQLFGEHVMQKRRRKALSQDNQFAIRNLSELSVGAPVVHIQHGVGRYIGLQTISAGDIEAEYLTLEYGGKDKLYVPVTSLQFISRYSGVDTENAPLHRLGSQQWQKEKAKAAKRASDVAAQLLNVYAKRASKTGNQFPVPTEDYQQFAASFPFEETIDQLQAIDAVITDMTSSKPMDRLICGDVGFGKTEVAIRAAFLAIQGNKQVAMLVPTTLLAQQHYETFCDRFADWPINIEVLSRFRSQKQQDNLLDKLQKGTIDIIIGTHKLLQKSIIFQRLGLVIIDEEHRFGVNQKEKLKALRTEVDILTLTATPIPRTLNMAISGIRDLSIIATPPAKRLSIKSFFHQRSDQLIREAVLREILRGGQVYFLHNNVKNIELVTHELQQLVPEARVNFAHGQLRERQLEKIMIDFYHQRFNVLVCSTIIETGIDIPTANTIIIDNADRFGLAQLHQLRGRVGRSHHQAYAYLMVTPDKKLTRDAEKRLKAIVSFEDLGVGFTLATHDLEIRGAGELLGDEQSGNIHSVGITLYTELLEKAVNALQNGQTVDVDSHLMPDFEVDLKISTLIPDDYLPDIHERLILYKRIANAKTEHQLEELQVEMIDRFGLLPQQTKNLFHVTALKLKAQNLGIRKIEANPQGGRIEFTAKTTIEPIKIIQLIQQKQNQYQLEGSHQLKFKLLEHQPLERIQAVEQILAELQS